MNYNSHFDFAKQPFTSGTDPEFFFPYSNAIKTIPDILRNGEGICLLTGTTGSGKTILCRYLQTRLEPQTPCIYLSHPAFSGAEMLYKICVQAGVETTEFDANNGNSYLDSLQQKLTAKQPSTSILIIDEAQFMGANCLDYIRILSSLEARNSKLLRILLCGSAELLKLLQAKNLNHRIDCSWHLKPLNKRQTKSYIEHRIKVAGGPKTSLFTVAASRSLYRKSKGYPYLLNKLASASLDQACKLDLDNVDQQMVYLASQKITNKNLKIRYFMAGILLLLTIAIAGIIAKYGTDIAANKSTITSVRPESSNPPVKDTANYGLELQPALKHLFATWNNEFAPVSLTVACSSANNYGLACWQEDNSNLANIIAHNRPAMLAIDGKNSYVIVESVDNNMLHIHTNDGKKYIDKGELQTLWSGYFLILWQIPPHYQAPLQAGDRGATVEWLRQQLGKLGYLAESQTADLFDSQLATALHEFQVKHNIDESGAGHLTWLRIHDVSNLAGVSRLY